MLDQLNASRLTIGVVGLGLIGGSMAKAFKKYTHHQIVGCDLDENTIAEALRHAAIDDVVQNNDFSACDLVFIALYPQQTVAFVENHVDHFKPGAILVDLCGIKRYLVEHLTDLCRTHDLIYLGAHPMAGKEYWGFGGSDADLFVGASMIITPDAGTSDTAIKLLCQLCSDLQFQTITTATPSAHDSMIAFTSQLAHIVSSAYIKSPRAKQHQGFSAGSYKDLTRVAKLNPQMWTELFLENADFLMEEIDEIMLHLQEYRAAIASRDEKQLYDLLEDGRKIKEALQ